MSTPEDSMSRILFQETQYPPAWIFGLLALVLLLPSLSMLQDGAAPITVLLPAAVVLGISLLFFPMTTTVDESAVHVRFGCFKLFRWRFPLQEIEDCRATTYTPMRTYLGWGIRYGFDHSRALTMKGDRAARLQLSRGRVRLIGSQRAAALARTIDEARGVDRA
jgi:hypothetical protein